VFGYFRLVGHDIVGIHGRAARSPRIPPPGAGGDGQGRFRMLTGFKNFLMRGDIVVVAIGLAIALAFSALIASFTANIINPIVSRAQGSNSVGLGVQLGSGGKATFLNFGGFISSIIYFVVFMLVIYYVIVVPYRRIQARRGVTAFGPPAPVKTCPACLSADLPAEASKCKYCGTDQPSTAAA